MLAPFECLCGNFILPEPASYVFFYAVFNLRNLLYIMPNAIFNLSLNAGEISVYAYLLFCENRKTYQCYPSFATIGKALGMSRPTVKKHVDSLVDKGLIYTEPTSVFTKAGKKWNGSLLYTIRPIQEAQDIHYERQLSVFEEMQKRSQCETRGR